MIRALVIAALLLAGCATTDPSGDREAPRAIAPTESGLRLAPDEGAVRTVQLYAGQNQTSLPILRLGGGQQLTLAFDVMGAAGRPLSVYYYHADRQWRRDLIPIEYMEGFQRDDLVRYDPSRATQVPYVHYEHRFPTTGSAFKISGNYVVRVTEQGNEGAVLFERPFFVTEEAVAAEMGLEPVLLGVGVGSSVQPIVQFAPTVEQGLSAFSYDVCFVQNGRFDLARCADRPARTDPRMLTFYLQPREAFHPNTGVYYADLRDLRVSSRVERALLDRRPYGVVLSPDAALFPAAAGDPILNGQTVTREARTTGDPGTTGEYLDVRFAFIPPDENPLRNVFLTGSFSGWQRLAEPMGWVEESRRYEQVVRLKQGEYEYRYVSDDPQLARAQANVLGRPDQQYAAFVYYRDPSLQTDRLIAARTAMSGL